ncbi:UNVERIFIED_CONTAM: Disease resistance protein [Sesamum latifolium]|uniref:Disease resistance protein n=1 Tax=Sesamum latifolium TaxID=2727402 RepID=A0AAW2XQR0_9LAMI
MMEKTFLLILDDVWNPIDLDRLGIPEPQVLKGGKIILTTRSSDVCPQMADVTLKIEALNKDEAWSLFCKSAGEIATWEEIEPLTVAITKECGGLPLAINVVGASLKRKRMVEVWKDSLNALRRSEPPIGSGLENKVYNPIKWSYDLLPNECVKSCFLFCCLFPEDDNIYVERLVRYWLAEGLLEEHHDIEEVMSRGLTIIETLKDRSLLEEGHYESHVKIHDIIRDVSIWISSLPENECRSLVRSGIGHEEMREDELSVKSYNRVSFMRNEIRKLPDALQKCPTVVTLLLQQNPWLKHIPDDFLLAFRSLKNLDLSYCRSIKFLPPCLNQLVELRVLLLQVCGSLETLPPVGGLVKLQVLVCCGTNIAALPQGMEKLKSLRQLDLSFNHKLTVIPVGLMSSLSNLEDLYLSGNDQLKFTGESEEILSQLREIMSLKRLSYLNIGLGSSACTLETTDSLLNWMKKLNKFDFFIGASIFEAPLLGRSSTKRLFLKDIHLWGERIEWLFANTDDIYFEECEGLDAMFQKLVANRDEVGCFDTVKSLGIRKYAGSFGVGSNAKLEMLPNLEDISLSILTNLSCASTLASQLGLKFSKLRSILVEDCPQLKYLISIGTAILSLEKLESITIDSCERVKEVFKFDQISSLQDSVFPNLKRITLSNCPRLRFVNEQNNVACPCLEEVSVRKCPLLKKLLLTAQNVGIIKTIRGEQEWWNRLEWENDGIKNALQPRFRPYKRESALL